MKGWKNGRKRGKRESKSNINSILASPKLAAASTAIILYQCTGTSDPSESVCDNIV